MELARDWMSAAVLQEFGVERVSVRPLKGFVFTKVTPTNALGFAGPAGLSPLCDCSFKTLKTFWSGIEKKKKIPGAFMSFFFWFLNESPSHEAIALAFTTGLKWQKETWLRVHAHVLCYYSFLPKFLRREIIDAVCEVHRALQSQLAFSWLIEAPEWDVCVSSIGQTNRRRRMSRACTLLSRLLKSMTQVCYFWFDKYFPSSSKLLCRGWIVASLKATEKM